MRKLSQYILVACFFAVASLAGIELVLRIVPATPSTYVPIYISDPVFGTLPNPEYEGHDTRGWRNEAAAERADIVAFGDSQTYGLGAQSNQAWPQRLSVLLKRTSYQMAFLGFGVANSLRLMPVALNLRPKNIVIGVYLGAVFTETWSEVYNYPPSPETEGLRSSDPEIVAQGREANNKDNGWSRSTYLDCQAPKTPLHPALRSVSNVLDLPPLATSIEKAATWWSRLLSDSMVWEDLSTRIARNRPPEELGAPYCIKIEANGLSAILSPAYRLITLDRTDPRNVEGERLVITGLQRMNSAAKTNGINLTVVLIPTKERAFQNALTSHIPPEAQYLERQWQLEKAAADRIFSSLVASKIDVVDALPALSHAIDVGVDPYQGATANGHPSAIGYDIIAAVTAEHLKSVD